MSAKDEAEEFEFRRRAEMESRPSIGPANGQTEYLEEAPAVNEMPPEMQGLKGTAVRALVKNFATNPKGTVDTLKKNFPQYDVKHFGDQIYFEKPGSRIRYVLDPEGGGIAEFGKDAADIVTDIGEGVATTAAGTAAAAAAAPATAGAGSVPAAMAAAGAAGTGYDYLKQGIGKLLGLEQDIDHGSALASGVVNAAGPLAFGTGAGAKQLLKAGVEEAGIKQAVARQSGYPMQLKDAIGKKIGPKVYSAMSGGEIPAETVRLAADKIDDIAKAEVDDTFGAKMGQSAQTDIKKMRTSHQQTGRGLDRSVSAGPDVDAAPAVESYLAEMDRLSKLPPTEAVTARMNHLMDEANYVFGTGNKVGADGQLSLPVSSEAAFDMQKTLHGLGNLKSTGSKGVGMAGNSNQDLVKQQTQNVAKDSWNRVNELLKPEGSEAAQKSASYAKEGEEIKLLSGKAKTPLQAKAMLDEIGRNEDLAGVVKKIDADNGTSILPKARFANAVETFRSKGVLPKSASGWMTRGGTSVLGGAAGYYGAAQTGSPGAKGPGAAIGAAGGALAGSPRAIRYFISPGKIRNQFRTNPITRNIPLSVWDIMKSRSQQNDEETP